MLQYLIIPILLSNIILDYWILNDYINSILYNDNGLGSPNCKLLFNRFLL